MLYPGLYLNQRKDGFKHLAGRAWKHLQHLLLHNHFVHDCLEVAQGTDHLLLLLLQPAYLLGKKKEQYHRTVPQKTIIFQDDDEHFTSFLTP